MEGASQYTVFLIDDDEAIRAYLTVILRGEGFNVVGEAGSIDKAQKQLRSLKADVVFLDINLPDADGLTALASLKAAHPKTCFIMISGDSTAEHVQTAIAQGARGFVAKPFTIENVAQAIARALNLAM